MTFPKKVTEPEKTTVSNWLFYRDIPNISVFSNLFVCKFFYFVVIVNV